MSKNRYCDGVNRRDFIRVGALSASSLTLASYLKLSEAGHVKEGHATSGIFIDLSGGPSHLDTFDPKPDAPEGIRGEFKTIPTSVAGVHISEQLPKMAKSFDKYALLRGVSHTLAAHKLGSEYVNTGSRPLASLEYPGYGAVLCKERPVESDIPPFVAIPNGGQRAGFLGIQYAPMNTGATPKAGMPFNVRGISLGAGVTVEQLDRRQNLLHDLDKTFASMEGRDQLLTGLDRFSDKAYSMLTSERARYAFDISKETPSFAAQFGSDPFEQSCLLAVRLIESGVRFVSLQVGGWDNHIDIFNNLKTKLLPKFDGGVSALLNGLEQKGLLNTTSVMITGEFGRTPKINTRATLGGRDHYPRCMFMLMAGGKVRGGQVIGQSDSTAAGPANESISPSDVAASFYHNLGIDPKQEFQTETGRPITLVRDGNVIPQLFA
ncbi:MAG: DUF1501 domain-containing protein [Planctomycetota bacterium]|nr:DUF1501 domain-containing protein [Planctomycetota bacterium]